MIKVSELEDAQLDYWTAKAVGKKATQGRHPYGFDMCYADGKAYCPSTNWKQGGPLIEEHDIGVQPFDDILCVMVKSKDDWFASIGDETQGVPYHAYCGAAPLIAACRCIVASKFGEEIDAAP